MVKRIYTADEQQQQAESQKGRIVSEAESVIQPLERAVRLNMATDEERNTTGSMGTLQRSGQPWIRQILNGHKTRVK